MDKAAAPQTLKNRDLLWMVIVLFVGEFVGVYISIKTAASHPELSNAFAAGVATLWFGACLGGLATLLFAEFDRRRLKRASQIEYVMNVLADLKAVYDQVDRGRTLILAHKSARTYGDEMRNLLQARVKLLQVVRALHFDERASELKAIALGIGSMDGYLARLIGEFEVNYKDISRAQGVYEARMKKALDAVPVSGSPDPELPANTPWDAIAALPGVHDLLLPVEGCRELTENGSEYCRQFLKPLDDASRQLRLALSAEFDRPALSR